MHRIPKDVSRYFAVIFSYQLSDNLSGYSDMDIKTLELVQDIDGYLGYEKYGNGKQNTFISYWKNLHSIDTWKDNLTHIKAKKEGPRWYKNYRVQIVEIHEDINHWL